MRVLNTGCSKGSATWTLKGVRIENEDMGLISKEGGPVQFRFRTNKSLVVTLPPSLSHGEDIRLLPVPLIPVLKPLRPKRSGSHECL